MYSSFSAWPIIKIKCQKKATLHTTMMLQKFSLLEICLLKPLLYQKKKKNQSKTQPIVDKKNLKENLAASLLM